MVQVVPGNSDSPFLFLETYDPNIVTTSGVLVQNAAQLILVEVHADLVLTTAEWYVTVQHGNVNVGVFSWDGSTATPLAITGSTAAGAANAKQSAALASSVRVSRGTIVGVTLATDSASFACLRTASISTAVGGDDNIIQFKAASFALDVPLASLLAGNLRPWVRLK